MTFEKSLALLRPADRDAARRDIELIVEWYRIFLSRKPLSHAKAVKRYRKVIADMERLRAYPYAPFELADMIAQLQDALEETEASVTVGRPPGSEANEAFLIRKLRDVYEKHTPKVAGRSSKETVTPRSHFVLFAQAVNADAGLGIDGDILKKKISEKLTGQKSDVARWRRETIRGEGLLEKFDRWNSGN